MGSRQSLIQTRQLRAQRARHMSLIHTVLVCLVSLIFIQFLLLTVALEAYLGGRGDLTLATALASGVCFVASGWLIRYVL